MSHPILANWRHDVGPLRLRMPVDPTPNPTVNWQAVYDAGGYHEDEDWLDRLDNRVWGTANPAETGGSGICFGHSTENLAAILVAIECFPASVKPDKEHLIRWLRKLIAWWEMTKDPAAARAIVAFVSDYIGSWNYSPTEPWIDRYTAQVQASPHVGTGMNGREGGWLSWGRGMQHKVARTSSVWSHKMLDLCALAAMPSTGQVLADARAGIDQPKVVYCFHQGILLMGNLALCKMLSLAVPQWCLDWMAAVSLLPQVDYYGHPSMPAFLYTDASGALRVATGSGQQPDPSFGWYQSCAVALESMGHAEFMPYATKWGPSRAGNEQDRKFSMLFRGRIA